MKNTDDRRPARILWTVIPLIIVTGLLLSCGSKDESAELSEKYADFERYTYGHFDIYFMPKSGWRNYKADIGQGYERFLTEICSLLEMPIPEDTIKLFIYLPSKEAVEIAGHEIPFSDDKSIHWAGYYPYGYELTKFLLRRKGVKPGRFHVLNEGLPHVLDFSSINYHDKTNRLINSQLYTPLANLGDNEIFDSLKFSDRRSQSASLCGFLMYNYGLDRLLMLWQSKRPWKESVETIFQMPIDEFEDSWKTFALAHADDPLGLVETDTVPDVKVEVQK